MKDAKAMREGVKREVVDLICKLGACRVAPAIILSGSGARGHFQWSDSEAEEKDQTVAVFTIRPMRPNSPPRRSHHPISFAPMDSFTTAPVSAPVDQVEQEAERKGTFNGISQALMTISPSDTKSLKWND